MKIDSDLDSLLKKLNKMIDANQFKNHVVQKAEVEDAVAVNYEYEFAKRNCSTGAQVAKTFDDICHTLANNELNNNCAVEEREELFESSRCPGAF